MKMEEMTQQFSYLLLFGRCGWWYLRKFIVRIVLHQRRYRGSRQRHERVIGQLWTEGILNRGKVTLLQRRHQCNPSITNTYFYLIWLQRSSSIIQPRDIFRTFFDPIETTVLVSPALLARGDVDQGLGSAVVQSVAADTEHLWRGLAVERHIQTARTVIAAGPPRRT